MNDPLQVSGILQAFGNQLASARDKKGLLGLIASRIAPIMGCSDILLSVVTDDQQTHHVYLHHCSPERQDKSEYALLSRKKFRVNDGVCNIAMASPSPLIVDMAGILRHADPPDYITPWYRPSISRMISFRLRSHQEALGTLFLFFEGPVFGMDKLDLVQSLSFLIAPVLKNMIAQERIHQWEKENESLLALSAQIASIKNRTDLFPILRELSGKNSFYKEIALSIVNDDPKTMTCFLIDGAKKRQAPSEGKPETPASHPREDGILNVTMDSKMPVEFNLEEIMGRESCPSYIRPLYERGMREMINVALRDRSREIGILHFFSPEKKLFDARQMRLLQGMSNQLGTAIASILAEEAMMDRKNEQALLLSLSTDFVKIRYKEDLLKMMSVRLKELFHFHHSSIGIVDKGKETFTTVLLDPAAALVYPPAFQEKIKSGLSYKGGLVETILQSGYPRVFDLEEYFPEPATENIRINYETGIREVAIVALRKEEESFGYLALFSKTKGVFSQNQLEILYSLSHQVSICLSNILTNETIEERENDKSLLLSLSKSLTAARNKKGFLEIVEHILREILPYDELTISRLNEDGLTHSAYLYDLKGASKDHPDLSIRAAQKYPVRDGIYHLLLGSETPLVYDMDTLLTKDPVPPYVTFFHENGMREMIAIPLRENNRGFGGVFIYLKQKGLLTPRKLSLLEGLCSQISISVTNIRAYEKIESQLEEIRHFKSRLEEENLYLQEQIKTANSFTGMVGSGAAMQKVYQLVSMVAPSDSTVLLLGETGTGKELVANAIHHASPRKDKFMIKVNCAALPANLVESELFGHEKGSFTGATERRIGKFELAHNGTLFLDEIGEMPVELQVKLLRAIQEREIERIGGKSVIRTNVRIIAATNRILRKEVEAGRFRSDLFYRLNVFPIHIPPLRERKEDIPMLASHFISLQTQKSGKKIVNISHKALDSMMRYDWPGNVRELEHLIERSVLMTNGPTIKDIYIPTEADAELVEVFGNAPVKSLEELERDHILTILKKCNSKIGGPGGAAELLRMPATTLHSRIKKLGIRKGLG